MLHLPLLHATLHPCPESWEAMTATADGRFCARCQHTVRDFSQAPDPAAALAAARAASPTGRVCGRFAASQVAQPRLSGRLRQFVVALVLVFGLGLPAHEALAQVRRAWDKAPVRPTAPAEPTSFMGVYVEQMPQYKDGGQQGIMRFMQQHLAYPAQALRDQTEGRVYLSFVVNKRGKVESLHVVKGLSPALDAEALRVARLMGDWKPGTQSRKPMAFNFTLPVTFRLEKTAPKPQAKRLRP